MPWTLRCKELQFRERIFALGRSPRSASAWRPRFSIGRFQNRRATTAAHFQMEMTLKYEFRTAAGRVCCSNDNVQYLCDVCKTKARFTPTASPNPYRAATDAAPRLDEATDDPHYDPYGEPPNGYALALQARTKAQPRPVSRPVSPRASATTAIDPLNGYALALQARAEENR